MACKRKRLGFAMSWSSRALNAPFRKKISLICFMMRKKTDLVVRCYFDLDGRGDRPIVGFWQVATVVPLCQRVRLGVDLGREIDRPPPRRESTGYSQSARQEQSPLRTQPGCQHPQRIPANDRPP